MRKRSAGLLLYRERDGGLEVLLVHPGGPYWAKKDDGVWSIPKGEIGEHEEPLAAARREFEEETSFAPDGEPLALDPLRQPSGKLVFAWAVRGDLDAAAVRSNSHQQEWPPRSGRFQSFPEVDRAGWFDLPAARRKILRGQAAFLDQLERRLVRSRSSGRARPSA
jgi:predicted NUDIX family NTP pyrophosphohydrolase